MEPLSYHKNGDGPRPLAHVDYPTGIADQRPLPDSGFGELWDVIILPQEIKDHLLGQAVFNFSARPKVNRAILPLHGIVLLYGPPGTGKTSLAKGLAHRTAEVCQGQFQFIEVDPHGLASSHLGRSQRAVGELFQDTLVEMSSGKPTIVLLDEVESLVVDRASLSLEANPIDVHRATDAALAQLDRLAERHPHILFVATSNFPKAIDRAFHVTGRLVGGGAAPGTGGPPVDFAVDPDGHGVHLRQTKVGSPETLTLLRSPKSRTD